MKQSQYEAKRDKWKRLHVAVDRFLDLRTKNGQVPAEAPEITELIDAHKGCENIIMEVAK